jgi:ribosome-associated protein
MSRSLSIHASLTIPAAELTWKAVRSSGPGGQNVNKVASKVELRFDLAHTEVLDETTRAKLHALARARLDAAGQILVVSQKTRDRERNLEDAREKLRQLILRALVRERPRKPTRPSRGAKKRRLEDKRHQAERKRDRRGEL